VVFLFLDRAPFQGLSLANTKSKCRLHSPCASAGLDCSERLDFRQITCSFFTSRLRGYLN
jgi:hypothetical protein